MRTPFPISIGCNLIWETDRSIASPRASPESLSSTATLGCVVLYVVCTSCSTQLRSQNPHSQEWLCYENHSTQSAMKIFVSCGALPLRFEAQTRRLPSEVTIGKASKSG